MRRMFKVCLLVSVILAILAVIITVIWAAPVIVTKDDGIESQLSHETKSLLKEIRQLENTTVAKVKEIEENHLKDLRFLQEELETTNRKLLDARVKISELENVTKDRMSELERELRENLRRKEEQLIDASARIEVLESELNSTKNKLKESRQELTRDLRQTKQELNATRSRSVLEDELSSIRARISAIEDTQNHLSTELQLTEAGLNEADVRLDNAVEVLGN
jgi:predicted  nucleic acid-binding Zn-ribbon protein